MLLPPASLSAVWGKREGARYGQKQARRRQTDSRMAAVGAALRVAEQERYEEIRPLVLFDASVAERAQEVGTSASTLYRRLDRFAEEGMESLFDAPTARRKRLPPAIRRLVVDLKAEYPPSASTR